MTLTKEQQRDANNYGGAEQPDQYRRRPGTKYSDKPDHSARSVYWQPNHTKHRVRRGS